jgi:hypothetical protein
VRDEFNRADLQPEVGHKEALFVTQLLTGADLAGDQAALCRMSLSEMLEVLLHSEPVSGLLSFWPTQDCRSRRPEHNHPVGVLVYGNLLSPAEAAQVQAALFDSMARLDRRMQAGLARGILSRSKAGFGVPTRSSQPRPTVWSLAL